MGAYLCNLVVGESMLATVKSKRVMHGSPVVSRRWASLGLVAGGTGIAPMLQVGDTAVNPAPPFARAHSLRVQIARTVLDDLHNPTLVHVLSINRRESDILVKDELDQLVAAHPDRLKVTYSLTAPSAAWSGSRGRGSLEIVQAALPAPTNDGTTMILVCGTDGFVDTWGGPVGRGPRQADGSKGPKVQGTLSGLLASAGFDASEVFKY